MATYKASTSFRQTSGHGWQARDAKLLSIPRCVLSVGRLASALERLVTAALQQFLWSGAGGAGHACTVLS